ncbi:MAG TPA: hypothetical protein VIO61_16880 [Anaerolineaceae bacterium]
MDKEPYCKRVILNKKPPIAIGLLIASVIVLLLLPVGAYAQVVITPTPDNPYKMFLSALWRDPQSTPDPTGNPHAGLTTYDGSATCIGCHALEASEVHSSAHYQWSGFTPNVPGMTTGGKATGLNDFCGYPGVNTWLGKIVNVDGVSVDGGCATCHVGIGSKPTAEKTSDQLNNIDCLVCHSDTYKRKVELVDGQYRMIPAPEKMSVSLQTALQTIQKPSKAACIACHAYGGGGANNKRGDIEPILANPPSPTVDVHMASKSSGGAGFDCISCHTTQNHRIAGRGSDLRETDLNLPVSCDTCHTSQPHSNARLDSHTKRINCTTCHIPTYARNTSTDMYRDFRTSELDTIKRLYEPKITRQANVIPEYRFFNGNSTFYNLGEPAVAGANGRVLLSGPLGSVNISGSKISPFKRHTATQPVDPITKYILPLKMGIVFQKGTMDAAILAGASAMGWALPQGYTFLETERYMQINHTVAPSNQALDCSACHYGGTRLNFADLGYTPKTSRNNKPLCASCHGDKSDAWKPSVRFDRVHEKHVSEKGINCSECHNFPRP